jgi:hypothetical protein
MPVNNCRNALPELGQRRWLGFMRYTPICRAKLWKRP